MTELAKRRRAILAGTSKGKSNMDGWTDGVPYTDLTIYKNSYYNSSGHSSGYNGWNRTGYVPCDGASTITFPAATGASQADLTNWSHWFDASNNSVGKIILSPTHDVTVSVPSTAVSFGLSTINTVLENIINTGIVPHA